MTKVEEIVLTLSNDGRFYKEWLKAKENKWPESGFRNLVRCHARDLLGMNPSIAEREEIRLALEKHWSSEKTEPEIKSEVLFMLDGKPVYPGTRLYRINAGCYMVANHLSADGYVCEKGNHTGNHKHNLRWPDEPQKSVAKSEVQQPIIKKEEEVMTQKGIAVQSVEIKTVTYLNGTPINDLSKEQLIDAIAMCEADLERLSKLNTKSKAITAKREAIQATIDKIVALLDQ